MDVSFEQVTYNYEIEAGAPAIVGLKDVSFTIPRYAFVAVIGQTGSGKSTLVQHINGLLTPSAGTIHVGEYDLSYARKSRELSSLRKQIGFVFQHPEQQLFAETVEKEIAFAPRHFGEDEDTIHSRVDEAMDVMQLDHALKTHSPFHLSGGEQRRVAIASVLAQKPEMLVLDEPGAGLDPCTKERFMQRLYHYHYKNKLTTWIITHDMNDVARFANVCIVMHENRVLAVDTPAHIFQAEDICAPAHITQPDVMRFAKKLGITKKPLPFLQDIPALVDWLADYGEQ